MSNITISRVKFSSSFLDKTIGLIGKSKPFPILLQTRFGIHTFFLAFPIDVLILDKRNKVVKKVENLIPNRIFFWNPIFKNVLELPPGTINKLKIKCYDTINLK